MEKGNGLLIMIINIGKISFIFTHIIFIFTIYRIVPGFHFRPGYIVMAESSQLESYNGGTMHSKLFDYVFGRSLGNISTKAFNRNMI